MNLLIRTDASIAIGTGHAMRCLALAQAWQDAGGHSVFAMAESTPAIKARLHAESYDVVSLAAKPGSSDDANSTVALARERNAAWVAVDGYQFGSEYQETCNRAGCKVLVLDDYGHASRYSADIVLNQNISARESLYASRDPHTQLLFGPRYCLLRREFASWRDWKRDVGRQCRNLLVMMGGSDSENVTARVLEAVAAVKNQNLQTTVVIGGSNPHLASLERQARASSNKIVLRTDIRNMPELMAEADLAISAAGSTCWELCQFGLPSLVLDVAANQTDVARELHRQQCAIHIGDRKTPAETMARELNHLTNDRELRITLSRNSRQLVDGRGAERVISVLLGRPTDFQYNSSLRLRPATFEDARLLLEWANDPEVRAAAFSSDPIPWETHVTWFAEKLHSGASRIMIAHDETNSPCGQIRFDARSDGGWEVDVSLAKTMRGRGLACRLIRAGLDQLRLDYPDAIIHALVKPQNLVSARAFEKAGFTRIGTEQTQAAAVHFIFESKSARQ